MILSEQHLSLPYSWEDYSTIEVIWLSQQLRGTASGLKLVITLAGYKTGTLDLV